jgi:hypothetical protein
LPKLSVQPTPKRGTDHEGGIVGSSVGHIDAHLRVTWSYGSKPSGAVAPAANHRQTRATAIPMLRPRQGRRHASNGFHPAHGQRPRPAGVILDVPLPSVIRPARRHRTRHGAGKPVTGL